MFESFCNRFDKIKVLLLYIMLSPKQLKRTNKQLPLLQKRTKLKKEIIFVFVFMCIVILYTCLYFTHFCTFVCIWHSCIFTTKNPSVATQFAFEYTIVLYLYLCLLNFVFVFLLYLYLYLECTSSKKAAAGAHKGAFVTVAFLPVQCLHKSDAY